MALKKDHNLDIHPNNRHRLIRFLNKENTKEECYPVYDAIYIGLTTNRETLYEQINKRTDTMFENGLIAEVKSFYDKGLNTKALNTAIGYKELYRYFNGELNLDEARDLIKKNCRHYAKRQYTWFNHQLPVTWFDTDFEDFNHTIDEVTKYIESRPNHE